MVQYVRVVEGPTPEQTKAFADLIVLGALGFFVYWLWQKVNAWETLAAPYNYISAYYYYAVVVPMKSFVHVWNWLQSSGLTPYPNLNLCLSILGIVLYAFLVLLFLAIVVDILERIGIKREALKGLIVLPAIFAFFWFIFSFIFSWLFSQ